MLIDADSWEKVSALFDQVATLSPAQRRGKFAELTLDATTRAWLDKLLAAHDCSDNHVLDQTLNRLAADLISSRQAPGGEIPEDLGGQMLGHWRVGEPIARGAMAVVMHGQRADGAYEQHVAIKLLQPGPYQQGESEQLREELRLLARLEHPGIARLIDGGISAQGWPFLVMEYVDGVHIDQWCAEHKLDSRARLQLMLKVCDAVHYAHSKLVVHADIKPSNVLINRHGEPKLVDFGIARLLQPSVPQPDAGVSILLRCSPAYAAPEQLRGEPPTTANDIFGLGALMYELLTGNRIREGKTVTALLLGRDSASMIIPPSLRTQSLTPSRYLRGDLDAICNKALAADARQRFGSVAELKHDLQSHLQHYPVTARADGNGYRLARWLRRNRLTAAATALVFTSLSVALLVSIHQARLATEHARRALASQNFLIEIFDAADPVANQQNPITVNSLVAGQADKINITAIDNPALARDLFLTLAKVQQNLGNHEQALQIYTGLLADDGATLDIEQEAMLEASVAKQLERLGQFEKALQHAQRAKALLPLDHMVSVISLQAVRTEASVLSELRRNQDAMQVLNDALAQRQNILQLPEGKVLLANLLADLSEKSGQLGETERALDALKEAEDLYRQAYPESNPEVAGASARRAGIYRYVGNFEQAAIASFRAAVEIRLFFPPLHSEVIRTDTALVVDLAYLKCYQQAIELYGDLIQRYQNSYGSGNTLTANALLNLASIQRKTGQYQPALDNINQTLDIYQKQSAPATDMTAFALGIKGQLLLALGQPDAALQTMHESLQIMRNAVGVEHPQSLRVQIAIGDMLRKLGRFDAAIRQLQPAYEALLGLLGTESAHTRDAALKLAAVWREQGDVKALMALRAGVSISDAEIDAAIDTPATPASADPQCRMPDAIDFKILSNQKL